MSGEKIANGATGPTVRAKYDTLSWRANPDIEVLGNADLRAEYLAI